MSELTIEKVKELRAGRLQLGSVDDWTYRDSWLVVDFLLAELEEAEKQRDALIASGNAMAYEVEHCAVCHAAVPLELSQPGWCRPCDTIRVFRDQTAK